MTTWEYLTLQLEARAKGSPGEHPVGNRLRKLGNEGWELAGVAVLEDPLFSLYVFKRPAESVLGFVARETSGVGAGAGR